MKVYTRTGDDGSTGLNAGGRVAKDSMIVEAYGTVDELSSVIGIVAGHAPEHSDVLTRVQNELFNLGSRLATLQAAQLMAAWDEHGVQTMESEIDQWDAELPALTNFILPGGVMAARYLHLARTVCRRAERRVTSLTDHPFRVEALKYLNRLSDWLFVLARLVNYRAEAPETLWIPDKEES